jgi:hypothetical protein
MSSNTFSNLANTEFNGNIVLTNPNSYIQFSNGSKQSIAGGGGGGGDVYLDGTNTYTSISVNNFEDAEITCATQLNSDNSTLVANTEFVQTKVGLVGQYDNFNTAIGGLNFGNIDTTLATNNSAFGNASLYTITTGYLNSCVGANCAYNLTTGTNNSLIGFQCCNDLTTGEYNSSCGSFTLQITNGSYNSTLGYESGLNDFGLSSFNTYLGARCSQTNTDTYSYNYLTLIGADSQPILTGTNNQIVLGRKNGADDIYIPSGNIYLGDNVLNSSYVIQASGNNSNIQFKTLPSIGTVYENTLTLGSSSSTLQSGEIYLTGDVTVSNTYSLTVNNTIFDNQGADPSFGTANAVIYFNASAPSTQQLRVNINGAQYYINLSSI